MDALLQRYDDGLRQYGDTARGAFWPNEEDQKTRFDVMLDVIDRIDDEPITLCDLGCGTGQLLTHIRERGLKNVTYIGVDGSALALSYARAKFPDATFLEIDVSAPETALEQLSCDYLVANGLFTGSGGMTHDEMWSFLSSTVRRVWPLVRRAMAFNVMSTLVEWTRDDLFHLSMDEAARLLHEIAGRNVRIRADYGLYEYTIFARKPRLRSNAPAAVPVARPLLPSTKHLLRYLPRIDKSRIYSNHGPLVTEFQERVCEIIEAPAGTFVTAATGSAAIAGAILATAGRAREDRPLAIVPAFTFVATALAVEQCGYTPYLADVNPNTWMLDPQQLRAHPRLADVGLIVPVAPFGRPVPQAAWTAFQKETGIPIVIDGAASFDLLVDSQGRFLGDLPVALSFHATKSFATGEGGGVVTTNVELATRTVQALNFGFHESRESSSPGINGKMSEYHAAVGLAELDGWPTKLAALRRVAHGYERESARVGVSERIIVTPEISSCYVLFRCRDAAETPRVQKALRDSGIDFRLWYGMGLHHHEHFSMLPHDALDATEHLGATLLGLPVAPDISDETIARIAGVLAAAIHTSPR